MKKYFVITLCFIVLILNVIGYSQTERQAKVFIYRAESYYETYKRYQSQSQKISRLIDKAFSLMTDARTYLRRKKYNLASREAKKAIAILKTIPTEVRNSGRTLTRADVSRKIVRVGMMFQKMKRYLLANEKLVSRFSTAKSKLRFAKGALRENKLGLAFKLAGDALKILFQIPKVYEKQYSLQRNARNKIFNLRVTAQYIKLVYTTEARTYNKYRRIISAIRDAERALNGWDFATVNRSTRRAKIYSNQLIELNKRLERRRQQERRMCSRANFAIKQASAYLRRYQNQLFTIRLKDIFTISARKLRSAKVSYKRGRCDDALKDARNSIKSLIRVGLIIKKSSKLKRQSKIHLRQAKELLKKVKGKRLPLDTVDQVENAQNNIRKAEGLIREGKFDEANSLLKSTIMLLSTILG